MRINNIEMQFQLGDFKDDIMTSPPYQKYVKGKLKGEEDPDYIHEFACRICASLNCRNLFFEGKNYLDLGQLNKKIKERNGYLFLHYMTKFNNDIEKVKEKCFEKESFVIPEILNEILGIKSEKEIDIKSILNIADPHYYYVVRTKFQKTGHYSMVYSKNLKYLDSYDCRIKDPDNILNLYELRF